ncbi:hypothetical protein NIES4103_15750 [Nostoc sp. NIES-4103]|nr:hypothetical protein NIES4103_15750 [Nostoc sp. NIES-4103]
MSESKPNKKRKQCILSKNGKEKLEIQLDKLRKQFPNEYDTQTDLADKTGLNRDTVKKILEQWNQKPVTYSRLDQFFEKIGISLNEEDYDNPPKQELEKPHKQTDKSNNLEYGIKELKNALQELGYDAQRNLFKESIKQVKPAATFLIYGQNDYGQKWLVNLLRYKHLPLHTTDVWQHPLKINRQNAKNIETIWQKLAGLLGIENSAPEILAEELYKHWETRPVILVLYIEHLADNYLEQFINQLWQPVVDKVNKACSSPEKNHRINKINKLILFLVDDANYQPKLKKCLLLEPDKTQSHKPVSLRKIEHFNLDSIENWVGLDNQCQLLPQIWKGSKAKANQMREIAEEMEEIVQKHTTPISVFREICECCELKWHDIEITLSL